MKQLVIVVGVLVVVAGIAYAFSKVEYTAPEEKTIEKTVEVDPIADRYNKEMASSSMKIEAEAYKEYLKTRDRLENELMLKVTREYREELETREAKLEEKVSL